MVSKHYTVYYGDPYTVICFVYMPRVRNTGYISVRKNGQEGGLSISYLLNGRDTNAKLIKTGLMKCTLTQITFQ